MKTNYLYLLAVVALLQSSCKPKYDEVLPKKGPVTEAVFASGSVEPRDAYIVTSLSDGFILKSYISENDIVAEKQILFRLDNRQQNTQVQIAETNVSYAQMNTSSTSPALQQILAQIDAAKIKMQTDSINMSRFERLYTTRSVSKQELDNAIVIYKSSLSSYKALNESYRATADKARQEYANSRSQLQNAQAGNKYYELAAISAGKVYQVYKKQGDLVRRGDKVAQIGNPDSMVIYLDIDEGSIGKIKEGQQVLVELNTDKGKTFEAVVYKVYPHFNETSQSYKVEARFTRATNGIISGTQLQANIVTNKKAATILIPHMYVMQGNKVLVKKGEQIDTSTITTGIVSDDWIEVLTGISESDKIVKMK
jgi:multidrug efflux pump subunit AcrA (membrane-fusion protein)